MKNSIKFYQISDLHIRKNISGPTNIPKRQGRGAFEKLKQLCDRFESEGTDALIITGDVLDVPRWMLKEGFYYDVDLSYWEQMVYLDYMALAALFKNYSFPIFLLPGNHDHPKLFRTVFGRQLEPIVIKGYTFYLFSDWQYRPNYPRRIDKERKLFDRALESGNEYQIHCQHYVIEPRLETIYPYNYSEATELGTRMIESGKVILSLSGHFHSGAHKIGKWGESETYFHTAKSFSEDPFPYYQVEIHNKKVHIEEMNYSNSSPMKKALFLDRDGCITVTPRYNSGPDEIELIPGVGEALAEIQKLGYVLIVISDQSSIGMGYTLKDMVHWTNDEICKQLQPFKVEIQGFYFSEGGGEKGVMKRLQHQKEKKPDPSLLLKAAEDFNIQLEDSAMVGDRITDCQCAINAGVKPFLVKTGFGEESLSKITVGDGITVVESLMELATTLKGQEIQTRG